MSDKLTIEEKMKAIDKFCDEQTMDDCEVCDCPIYTLGYCQINDSDWTDDMIDKAYALIAKPPVNFVKVNRDDEVESANDHIAEADKMVNDAVNHPNHYCNGGIECIAAIRASMTADGFMDYCKGNVLKYLWRWKDKNGIEDLRKARVYLDWLIEEVEKDTK